MGMKKRTSHWRLLVLLMLGATAVVCVSCKEKTTRQEVPIEHRAEGFTIDELGLRVVDPREGGTAVRYQFADSASITDTLVTFSSTPQRVVCLSTTYVAFMASLGLEDRIVGVSSGGYVMNPRVVARISQGLVQEVGSDMALDYEAVISLRPDVVLAYATTGPKPEFYGRLAALGIPVVMVGDYMERTPLARSEWVRAIGWLMGEGAKADSVQNAVSARYEEAKALVEGIENRPRVLLNLPWQETWYIPGGKTYLAEAFHDAGAAILTAGHDDSPQSTPISLEEALTLGLEADYWFHPGMATTLQEVAAQNELFRSFPSFKAGRVWNSNLRQNANGANDYYESGVMAPDVILKDLIAIFHPDRLPGHVFTYYRHLE